MIFNSLKKIIALVIFLSGIIFFVWYNSIRTDISTKVPVSSKKDYSIQKKADKTSSSGKKDPEDFYKHYGNPEKDKLNYLYSSKTVIVNPNMIFKNSKVEYPHPKLEPIESIEDTSVSGYDSLRMVKFIDSLKNINQFELNNTYIFSTKTAIIHNYESPLLKFFSSYSDSVKKASFSAKKSKKSIPAVNVNKKPQVKKK